MYIITGGAGFIGSALLWELNGRGIEDILIVDNLAASEKWRNLVHCRYRDYMHRDSFREAMRAGTIRDKIDGIAHLGACSATTERDADFLMDNNFHYSREVCAFALEHGARFLNASSAATYGGGENGFSDDPGLLQRLRPLNMYGYSKHLFDLWLNRQGLLAKVASLKFFNVYGPNEYHKGDMKSIINKLFHQIMNTGRAALFASSTPDYPSGGQLRDFVYVKDCARLMAWLLIDNPSPGGIFNVGTGKAATFNEVAAHIFNALGRETLIDYIAMPDKLTGSYQNYTCADMGWLERLSYPGGFRPVREGIEDYVGNYLTQACPWLDSERREQQGVALQNV